MACRAYAWAAIRNQHAVPEYCTLRITGAQLTDSAARNGKEQRRRSID